MHALPTNGEDTPEGEARSSISRRKLIAGTAAGAGALWVAPNIVGLATPAAAASICPTLVAGSVQAGYTGASGDPRVVSLNLTGLQTGDVWVCIAAWTNREGSFAPTVAPAGFSTLGPFGVNGSSDLFDASVKAAVYYKRLVAADHTGGNMTTTITSTDAGITRGGLRVATAAWRSGSVMNVVGATGSAGTGESVTFPAPTSVPGGNYITVRLGAVRGYGGVGGGTGWTTQPASVVVNNYSSTNNYDRALSITTQCNNSTTAAATWEAGSGTAARAIFTLAIG